MDAIRILGILFIATGGLLGAITGHALATVARRTGDVSARGDARDALETAVTQLDPHTHARAVALCHAQLAVLHLEAGAIADGVPEGRRAVELAAGIRSARLVEHLAALRTAAAGHEDSQQAAELVVDLDAATGPRAERRRRAAGVDGTVMG